MLRELAELVSKPYDDTNEPTVLARKDFPDGRRARLQAQIANWHITVSESPGAHVYYDDW